MTFIFNQENQQKEDKKGEKIQKIDPYADIWHISPCNSFQRDFRYLFFVGFLIEWT